MRLSIFSLIHLFCLQSGILSTVACDRHHHHHHHWHGDDASKNLTLADHRSLEAAASEQFSCGAKPVTQKEKRETGKVYLEWKKGRSSGAPGWWNHHGRRLQTTNYLIPITFHVIRQSNGAGDVSNSKIAQYVDYINTAFMGTNFQFYQKTILRTDNSEWYNCNGDNFLLFSEALHQGGKADMNVYFCSLPYGTGGFAYYPYGTAGQYWDGIVMESDYTKYNFPSSYTRRTVLPHEAGHWLGLHHTFEDECDATYSTRFGWPAEYAQFNGDGVADTPAHRASSQNCAANANTCSDTTPGVDPGPDNLALETYMSYAQDSCQVRFTPGQIDRANAMFAYFRYDESVVVTNPNPAPVPATQSPVASPTFAPVEAPTSYCTNDSSWRDSGCPANQNNGAKVCVLSNNREPGAGLGGDKCAQCVNHKELFTSRDRGCPVSTPTCVMNDGSTPNLYTAGEKCIAIPIPAPIAAPTRSPIAEPTRSPMAAPTRSPLASPTKSPIAAPTRNPFADPTSSPIAAPTRSPMAAPTTSPIAAPTRSSPVALDESSVECSRRERRRRCFQWRNLFKLLFTWDREPCAACGDL